MPMFETYKVSSYLERFSGETRPTRLLDMAGPVLFHGIQNHAFFAFSSCDGFSNQVAIERIEPNDTRIRNPHSASNH
jgi:hypothetical protein